VSEVVHMFRRFFNIWSSKILIVVNRRSVATLLHLNCTVPEILQTFQARAQAFDRPIWGSDHVIISRVPT